MYFRMKEHNVPNFDFVDISAAGRKCQPLSLLDCNILSNTGCNKMSRRSPRLHNHLSMTCIHNPSYELRSTPLQACHPPNYFHVVPQLPTTPTYSELEECNQ